MKVKKLCLFLSVLCVVVGVLSVVYCVYYNQVALSKGWWSWPWGVLLFVPAIFWWRVMKNE